MPNLGSLDLSVLQQLWRQSLQLNIRFYSAVGRLTADYYKDLFTTLTDIGAPPSQSQPQPQASGTHMSATPQSQPAAPSAATPAPQAGVMVLEGEADANALGVFLIANNLKDTVSTHVTTSSFADADGHIVKPAFTFDPEVVSLAPGEQLLVRVTTCIPHTLEPDVRYRGEFTIPELSGTRIPIVVRRRPEPVTPANPSPSMAEPDPGTPNSRKATKPAAKRPSKKRQHSRGNTS